jgi:hypothetical protein
VTAGRGEAGLRSLFVRFGGCWVAGRAGHHGLSLVRLCSIDRKLRCNRSSVTRSCSGAGDSMYSVPSTLGGGGGAGAGER